MWDPIPDETGEICIGDVGYIREGRFFRLVNAISKADDEINSQFNVPNGFKPLDLPSNAYENYDPRSVTLGPILKSDSISIAKVSGEAKWKGIGGTLHFSCAEDSGAMLANPRQVVHKQKLRPNKLITSWTKKWHRILWKWATEKRGLVIGENDLIFVYGWVKTANWAVARSSIGVKRWSYNYIWATMQLPRDPSSSACSGRLLEHGMGMPALAHANQVAARLPLQKTSLLQLPAKAMRTVSLQRKITPGPNIMGPRTVS